MRKNFKQWLFITSDLEKKNWCCEKVLLGVPNEAVLVRITKVHLDIKRSLGLQTFSNCEPF